MELQMRTIAYRQVLLFIALLYALLEAATCQTCSEEQLNGLTWPSKNTSSSINVTVDCPTNGPGVAFRACSVDSLWGPPNYIGCSLQSLVDLYDRAVNSSSLTDLVAVAAELAAITETDISYSGQLLLASDVLYALYDGGELNQTETSSTETDMFIQNIIASADNLLGQDLTLWQNVYEFHDVVFFFGFLERLEGFGSVITSYLDRTAHAPMELTNNTNFKARYEAVPQGTLSLVHSFDELSTTVTIPQSYLAQKDVTKNARVATLVFTSDVGKLIPSTSGPGFHIDADNVSSLLVSCSVFPQNSTEKADSVEIRTKNTAQLPNSTCSYLQPDRPQNIWVEDLGRCRKPVFHDDMTVTCKCRHLTTFAVVGKYKTRGSLPNAILASIVLYLILIATTFGLLLYANRRFESDRASVVLCFLASLFAGHLTLVTGIYAIDNQNACRAVALMLHYFQLSYSFWMLSQAVQLVLKMTYKTTESSTVAQFLALGWITPSFVVASTAGLSIEYYGRGNYCALPLDSDIALMIIVPQALIGVTNFVCLFYAFYCFQRIKKTDRKCLAVMNQIIPNIRACLIVLPFGICEWIFGACSIHYELLVYDVLWTCTMFAMCILIFLFYGIGSTEVIAEYEKSFGPCCWRHKKSSAVHDSPRPGWRDEISQISQYHEASSIMRDMDSGAPSAVAGNRLSASIDGSSGINNGGLEMDDVLSRGKELNDPNGASNSPGLSSSFTLKTKLKVFPLRKTQPRDRPSAAKASHDGHR